MFIELNSFLKLVGAVSLVVCFQFWVDVGLQVSNFGRMDYFFTSVSAFPSLKFLVSRFFFPHCSFSSCFSPCTVSSFTFPLEVFLGVYNIGVFAYNSYCFVWSYVKFVQILFSWIVNSSAAENSTSVVEKSL